MSSKRKLTDQERAQRRAQDRERLKQAAEQLPTVGRVGSLGAGRAMFQVRILLGASSRQRCGLRSLRIGRLADLQLGLALRDLLGFNRLGAQHCQGGPDRGDHQPGADHEGKLVAVGE
jgi:hypothetical protein